MTEKQLIQKIRERDETAFREMVELYQVRIVRTCYSIIHNQEDSEEIAQDVFIELYEKISGFRGTSKLSTWLYRVAINKSLNFIRRQNRMKFVEQMGNILSSKDKNIPDAVEKIQTKEQETLPEITERRKILHAAIDTLPLNQKITFTLHQYDELSYKEIAEVMNISLSSVESLIHRAKKNLQKKLVNYYKTMF